MTTLKTIKIELSQGENTPIVMSEQVESNKLTEVSGTLAYRILKLRQNAKRFKMNLGGFSFARKFDVKITIGENSASGTDTLGRSVVKFGITIQSKETSADNFNDFIGMLINDILCGDSQIEGDFAELKENLNFN